jgi:hypothetical protein
MHALWLFCGYGPDGALFAPSRKDVSLLNPQFDDLMPTDMDAENAGMSIFLHRSVTCVQKMCVGAGTAVTLSNEIIVIDD